jgi:histone H3/H4
MTSGIKRLNITVLLSHDLIKLGMNIQPIKRIVRKYFMKNGISSDVYIHLLYLIL